jgi:hypothetical protein
MYRGIPVVIISVLFIAKLAYTQCMQLYIQTASTVTITGGIVLTGFLLLTYPSIPYSMGRPII